MIDTVRLESDRVSPLVLAELRPQMSKYTSLTENTGEIHYSHHRTAFALDRGAPVELTIKDRRWVKAEGDKQPRLVPCEPYLQIECSLHRAMLGHNIVGGPTQLHAGLRWLLDTIAAAWHVELPGLLSWRLSRIDWAECFDLGSEEAVRAWLDVRKQAYYPRRELLHWRNLGFAAYGTDVDLRCYAKGAEYVKKAMRRSVAQAIMDPDAAGKLLRDSMQYLRVEVSLKRGSIVSEYPSGFAASIHTDWPPTSFDKHWGRFMRDSDTDDRVRRAADVQQRLFDTFSRAKAISLLGVWYTVAANGESWYRAMVPRATSYAQLRALRDAGIALEGTDVRAGGECIPLDFVPNRNSPRRLSVTHPDVADIEVRYA